MKDDHALEALFAAERRAEPPGGAAERGWARLSDRLARGDEPLELPHNVVKVSFRALGKWAAVALVASALGAVALRSTAGETYELPTAARARDERPSVSVPEAAVAASAAVTSAEKATVEPTPPEVPRAARPASSPKATKAAAAEAEPSAAPASTFDDELRLIKLAKSQLDSGRSHLAKVTLDEHARRFPNGTFQAERDALQILMLCQAGEGERGGELAQEFARTHAGSPVAERLLHTCRVESATQPPLGK